MILTGQLKFDGILFIQIYLCRLLLKQGRERQGVPEARSSKRYVLHTHTHKHTHTHTLTEREREREREREDACVYFNIT